MHVSLNMNVMWKLRRIIKRSGARFATITVSFTEFVLPMGINFSDFIIWGSPLLDE